MDFTYLREATAQVQRALPMEDPGIARRFDRAYDIVIADGGYELVQHSAAIWLVNRASTSLFIDNAMEYVVDTAAKTCTCPDFSSVRAGLCKHRMAVMIMCAMQDVAQQGAYHAL
jgi:hypothetical protein